LKRLTLKKVSIILLIFFFTLTTGCSGEKTTPQAVQDPIKIGLLVPYTDVFASNGYDITRGIELYFDEIGWKAAGREIKLIKEDSEMKGPVALQKARRLVESEKIDILTGIVSSSVAYALRDYIVANQIPLVLANAGAVGLTKEQGSKYIFRVSFANGQFEYPMGEYAFNELKLRKIVVLAPDYAAGHEKAQGFMDAFKASGGEIIQEIYPPLGTTDFGPYLAQINKDADAVWVHFSGTDSIRFVNQYAEYGLKEKFKYPLLSSGDLVDESSLPHQGDAPIDILNSHHYSAALNTPENKKYVESYRAKYNEDPNMFSEQGYVAARVIVAAIEALEGDLTDTEKLLDAIRKVEFKAPRGPFKFDPKTQNVIFDTYIRKVEKINGKLQNTVIHTVPAAENPWYQLN